MAFIMYDQVRFIPMNQPQTQIMNDNFNNNLVA